ncbi:MAG: hypothetical protein QM808_17815 [Steroidobacteraceae bacterium]
MNTKSNPQDAQKAKPAFVAKIRHGSGRTARYEQIGVGFQNESGSIYVTLAGTQLVSELTLYPLNKSDEQTEY